MEDGNKPRSKAEILRQARFILNHEGWTQHLMAVDEHGYSVNPFDVDNTCAFCTLGAIYATFSGEVKPNTPVFASPKHVITRVGEVRYELETTVGVTNIPSWNDRPGRTKEEVIDLFDRTIARLESEEKLDRAT